MLRYQHVKMSLDDSLLKHSQNERFFVRVWEIFTQDNIDLDVGCYADLYTRQ